MVVMVTLQSHSCTSLFLPSCPPETISEPHDLYVTGTFESQCSIIWIYIPSTWTAIISSHELIGWPDYQCVPCVYAIRSPWLNIYSLPYRN